MREFLLDPAPGSRIEAARNYGVDLTLLVEQLRLTRPIVRVFLEVSEPVVPVLLPYSLNSSRSRRVCTRLTGTSVCLRSSMRSW